MRIARLLYEKFVSEYGTILCPAIQQQLFGRHFFLKDPEEYRKFEEAGGHDPKGCPHVAGNAGKWTMEILLDTRVIEVEL